MLVIVLIGAGGSIAWRKFATRPARRDDLWRVVHGVCGSVQRVLKSPSPCIEVDKASGFALVPGGLGSDELLLVPTRRITGIEDTALLDPNTPNYWALAWDARRHLLHGARPVPDDWVGLAVNSAFSRTQDQLHIHIDCVKPDVRRVLDARPPTAGHWIPIEPLPGHGFAARLITDAQLRAASPFRLLAQAVGSASDAMARQTLVLIRAPSVSEEPRFYLLRQAYHASSEAGGHGEELLDHGCIGLGNTAPQSGGLLHKVRARLRHGM